MKLTAQSQSISFQLRPSLTTSQQIGGHSEGVTGWTRGLTEGGGFSTEHTQTEGTAKEGKNRRWNDYDTERNYMAEGS